MIEEKFSEHIAFLKDKLKYWTTKRFDNEDCAMGCSNAYQCALLNAEGLLKEHTDQKRALIALERRKMKAEDLIALIDKLGDFDVEISFRDEKLDEVMKNKFWQTYRRFVVTDVADVGYSDKVILLDIEER